MSRHHGHVSGVRSIARGMKRAFNLWLFVVCAGLGLLLLCNPPDDDPGHVVRIAGVIMMAGGLALLLAGPDEREVLMAEPASESGARRSRIKRVWSRVAYVCGGFLEKDVPREGWLGPPAMGGEGAGEQEVPPAEARKEDTQ